MTWIGIDVGGTKLLAVAVQNGNVIDRVQLQTGRDCGPERLLDLIEHAVGELPDGRGIGVGFPGLVAFDEGVVRSTVMLHGWHDVRLADQIAERTALPCVVDNDVNTAALAEARQRSHKGSMLFVAVGTGIGGAILDGNGALWRGSNGFAGEIGNTIVVPNGKPCWCGLRGCLNTVASGSAIELALGIKTGQLHTASGPALNRELAVAGAHLGGAIAKAVQLLNPAVVAIGGGVVNAGAAFVNVAREQLLQDLLPEIAKDLVVEAAAAGWAAGAVGAALLAEAQA